MRKSPVKIRAFSITFTPFLCYSEIMKIYKLTIAYDGSDYSGWQAQNHKPSIAAALNHAFKKVFKTEIKVLGASRTDAGVHALGQVARIKTDLAIPAEKLKWAWNNALPADISIRSLELVDDSFNPFCNVAQKIYYYHFFVERPLPFTQRYGYFYPYKIDFDVLKKALQFFVGTHDFASFRSSEDLRENTIRTVDAITLEYLPRYKAYRITIKGQKFLRHMIRRIVGASLAVATRGSDALSLLQKTMDARNPAHTLPNAPAQGLMLYKIVYKNTSSHPSTRPSPKATEGRRAFTPELAEGSGRTGRAPDRSVNEGWVKTGLEQSRKELSVAFTSEFVELSGRTEK